MYSVINTRYTVITAYLNIKETQMMLPKPAKTTYSAAAICTRHLNRQVHSINENQEHNNLENNFCNPYNIQRLMFNFSTTTPGSIFSQLTT